MDDTWQQFHRLPKLIRNAVATPQALGVIDRLEQANPGLDLAGFIMRVMVKEISVQELGKHLVTEAGLPSNQADQVVDELTRNVFSAAGEYLGLPPTASAPASVAQPPPVSAPAPIQPADVPMKPVVPTAPMNLPVVPAPVAMPSQPAAVPTPPPMTVPNAPIGNVAPAPSVSAEDDAEIAAHTAKLRTLVSAADGAMDFDTIAQKILDQHQLAFQEDLLAKRAIAVVKTRLKNIRSADDTKAMLMRPPKVGGLGLDPDIATGVSNTIETFVTATKARGMTAPTIVNDAPPPPRVPPPEQQRPAAMPPLSRDFQAMKPDAPAASVTEQSRPSRPIYRPADIPAPPVMPPSTVPTTTPQPTPPPQPVAPTPPVRPVPSAVTARPRSSDRPSVSDVTAPVSTLGPAEEMKSFTLAQFRRLGQGAGDSANHILDKLKHLQDESFALWAESVAGWRQSEVYRIYLDMGRQSLDQSISIDQVIQHRASSGLPYLSEHEFNVLADMNRHLTL